MTKRESTDENEEHITKPKPAELYNVSVANMDTYGGSDPSNNTLGFLNGFK